MTHSPLKQTLWAVGNGPAMPCLSMGRPRLKELEADTWIETLYGMGYRFTFPNAVANP